MYLYRKHGPQLFNCPGHALFEHCALLEETLAPYPEVSIVLSTSWVRRYRGSIRRVSRRLTPALRARVIGSTYHSRMDPVLGISAPHVLEELKTKLEAMSRE
ncbi:conserved hypothetical protein [Paraburkholderia piptadeniae]|uniref:Uncharacterized protein n=1 Tax=Paraburkholderia piptadeniae TaxID=1701573 RepID=A0A1N7RWK5_9BURK|nr:conserved hypothetical protein [Paraburkholderia piptadeniae]